MPLVPILELQVCQFIHCSQLLEICGTSRSHVRYWVMRFQDPSFHNSTSWGGYRNSTFSYAERPILQNIVLQILKHQPTIRLAQLARQLSSIFNKYVSRTVLPKL